MKKWRVILVVLVMIAGIPVLGLSSMAQASDALVYTCDDLNDPSLDGDYPFHNVSGVWDFKAGDTIRLQADMVEELPLAIDRMGADVPGGPVIWFDKLGTTVKVVGFPGVLKYTFSADETLSGIAVLEWGAHQPLPPNALKDSAAEAGAIMASWEVSCGPSSPTASAAGPVPGCDLGMELTPDAAVGAFVWTTDVYWAPDVNATTEITMPAGKTAWVLGMDETGEFYQFIWSCNLLWAPVGTMGPNYDAVWNGAPLPTTVVS